MTSILIPMLTEEQVNGVIEKASQALADYCKKAGIQVTVTGVSGGLDSAVTIALSQKAAAYAATQGHELRSIGLLLPCQSDPEHTRLGRIAIEAVSAEALEIDLTAVFEQVEKSVLTPVSKQLEGQTTEDLSVRYRTAQGNVKARLRMALGTYYVANMLNGLVLSTDNYSEYWMGFWTLHGDVGDFGMIQELWKGTELVQIAKVLGVPQEVIDAEPTDGLGISEGGDKAQLGASYEDVDEILKQLAKKGVDFDGSTSQLNNLPELAGFDRIVVQQIAQRALRNAFKRSNPRNLSRKELGL